MYICSKVIAKVDGTKSILTRLPPGLPEGIFWRALE
jgi:hypothetical protein